MDVGAAVAADEQSLELLEPGEGAFDDPSLAAEARAMLGLTTRDDRLDAALPDEAAVLVVVVATVGDQRRGTASRATDPTTHGRHSVEQTKWLRHVVAVAASQRPGERNAAAVYEQ